MPKNVRNALACEVRLVIGVCSALGCRSAGFFSLFKYKHVLALTQLDLPRYSMLQETCAFCTELLGNTGWKEIRKLTQSSTNILIH